MLPPDDRSQESASHPEPDDEPRHPFTYRAPAEAADEPEPVSAEEVADEARRNDAVLIGAAVLMAIVFACTTIADSRTLVHVKTGEYLASHGVLPPRVDVFSATAADRPWINLGWLFDLGVAGLHAVGGMTALTIFQAAAAVGVVILILACRRRDVSSWWASFVAVLAAMAAMPQFEARPVIVTLLGLGATLWILTRYRQEVDDRSIWLLVPLYLLWSNLDPRMFLGLAALLLYGIGEVVGSLMGRSGFEDGSRRARYWLATVASIGASFFNPFFWRAPLGAVHVYGGVDPAYRRFYQGETTWLALEHLPLFRHPPLALLDTALLAALLLAVVSLVAMLLNRRRLDLGHVGLWLGFVGFGMLAGREWPASAIVFAVLAIQNAEEWYRHTFRQTYGTDRSELIFSRGGRALTVLSLFAIAVLWLLGRIVPDDGRRPGFGLDPALGSQVESYAVLFDEPFDEKVFNFNAVQGDLLIWSGLKPFIDHRLDIYRGVGNSQRDDLVSLHDETRRALRIERPGDPADFGANRPEVWRAALDRFEITQALPRLTFPNPSYRTYFDLLQSENWRLAKLDAAGAVFLLAGPDRTDVSEYLAKNGLNLAKAAFREPDPLPDFPPIWPRQRVWSDSVTRPAPIQNDLARALHYLRHLEEAKQGLINLRPEAAFAFSYLTIRDSYAVLATDPQNLNAYRCLGQAYETLYLSELNGTGIQMRRRIYQALNAYGQALTIAPNDPVTHERLVGLYLVFNKMDLSARARERYESLSGQELPAPANKEIASQLETAWQEMRDRVAEVTKQANEALENGQPRFEVAIFAWQNGCTLLALELLEADPAAVEGNAGVTMLRALLLLEAARPHEAFDLLANLEGVADQAGVPNWREPLALASLALPDFTRAEALWQAQAAEAGERHLMAAMHAVPLGGQLHGQLFFPVWQTSQVLQAMEGSARDVVEPELNAALCALEAGRVEDAERTLSSLLERYPLSPFTNLAGTYLSQIRGEQVELSFGSEPEEDRFETAERRLDQEVVEDRLKAVGPIAAPRP